MALRLNLQSLRLGTPVHGINMGHNQEMSSAKIYLKWSDGFLNIMIVHNYYKQYGGEDKAVEDQVRMFSDKGHNVLLYSRHNTSIENESRFKIVKNAYWSKDTVRDVSDTIKKFKPDIAHIHNIYPLISPSIYQVLSAWEVPIVQTVHNYRFVCPNGKMFNKGRICTKCLDRGSYYQCGFNKCYRNSTIQSFWYANVISSAFNTGLFKKIDKFIVLNDFMKKVMLQKGFDLLKISVIPNFTFPGSACPSFAKEDYILYLGRLSEEKGIITLLKALQSINCIKLKIAGEGELKEEILQFCTVNNMKNVEILGYLDGIMKDKLISCARAVIAPSEWFEPFGLSVIEGFALGTPAVVSNTGGLRHLVDDYINGIKFQPGNVEDLRHCIEYLFESDKMVSDMPRRAYEAYVARYSPDAYYVNMMEIYKEVIYGKRQGGYVHDKC